MLEDEEDPGLTRLRDYDARGWRREASAVGPHLVRAGRQVLHREAAGSVGHDPDIGADGGTSPPICAIQSDHRMMTPHLIV